MKARTVVGREWRKTSRAITGARTTALAAAPTVAEPGITADDLRAAFLAFVKAPGVTAAQLEASIAPVKLKSGVISAAQIELFFKNIRVDEAGCWIWQGPVTDGGLPKFAFCPMGGARLKPAAPMGHRTAWAWFRGLLLPYPNWRVVQKCGVKRCVCPAHLRQERVPEKSELTLSSARLAAIFEHVTQTDDGCWYWTGSINKTGYAVHTFEDGALRSVDGVLFNWFVGYAAGQAAYNFQLLHTCESHACVNPVHMKLVAHGLRWTAEHIAKGEKKIATPATERTDA